MLSTRLRREVFLVLTGILCNKEKGTITHSSTNFRISQPNHHTLTQTQRQTPERRLSLSTSDGLGGYAHMGDALTLANLIKTQATLASTCTQSTVINKTMQSEG